MESIDDILNKLRERGFRITKARKCVLMCFLTSNKPIAPLTILTLLAENEIKVNKSTVYREIDFLIEQNLIKKIRIDHTSDMYELKQRPHHHHAVCTDCGSIEDLTFNTERKLLQEAQKQTSLKINDHALEFYGICPNCI